MKKVLNKGFVKLLGILGKDFVKDKSNIILQFEVKCPFFITKILSLYKSVSQIKELKDEFYIPAFYFKKDSESFSEQENNELYSKFDNFHNWVYNFYKKLLSKGLSKEQADMILPQDIYTQFFWTVDLRTLFYVIRQNINSSYEVRQYMKVFLEFLQESFPDMEELKNGIL